MLVEMDLIDHQIQDIMMVKINDYLHRDIYRGYRVNDWKH